VGTLVERTSRLPMFIKRPEFNPASAVNVMQMAWTSPPTPPLMA
jgi:hypothetical protein